MKMILSRGCLLLSLLLALWGGTCRNAWCAEARNPSADAYLANLKDPDAEVRIRALRELQTSLDPRIPDAMLSLLADEGNSIRRLAARALGSRWWQIPKERVPVFVNAVKRNLDSKFEDEQNMVRRALGLLNRDYQGDMFARSPNGRWVIYERRGWPCLIDTKTETEELLGWEPVDKAWLISALGNEKLNGSARWHDKKEIVALDMLLSRRHSAVWIWRHHSGLRKLGIAELAKALGHREDKLFHPGYFFTKNKGWYGNELRFEVSYSTQAGDAFSDHAALLGWDAVTDKLRVISASQPDR